MKKYIYMVSLLLVLVSCDVYNEIADMVYEDRFSGAELVELDIFDGITQLCDVGDLLHSEISYVKGDGETFQQPQETWDLKTASCPGYAVAFLNIAYFELGLKGSLAIVEQSEMSRIVVEGGFADHIMVEYDGVIYEPRTGAIYNGPIGYRIPFDHLF